MVGLANRATSYLGLDVLVRCRTEVACSGGSIINGNNSRWWTGTHWNNGSHGLSDTDFRQSANSSCCDGEGRKTRGSSDGIGGG